MKRPAIATLSGSPDEVEAQFYEALQRADIEALMAVWADDDEIVCVHPGGPRVIGAGAIRASFEAIFASGGIPVRPEQVHRMQQLGSALHHLVERVQVQGPQGSQDALVLATNWFVQTPQGWRLASHHASPGVLGTGTDGTESAAPMRGDGTGSSLLH
jgi:ketosteroid isomerase-like protein